MPSRNHPSVPGKFVAEHISRRRWLKLGGLMALSTTWPAVPTVAATAPSRKAKSCILIYLLGGPPHQDMWDLKPQAPAEVRGPFAPIATAVPGFQICEHMPRLAALADRYAVVRSVSHPNNNHTPMIYYTLTGRHVQVPEQDNDISPPNRGDSPHLGSVVAHLLPPPAPLPAFVSMPEVAVRSSEDFVRAATPLRGGRAGFLGAACDPFIINADPRQPRVLADLQLPEEVSAERLARREALLAVINSRRVEAASAQHYNTLRQMAVQLTGSPALSRPFALEEEPSALRERYGMHRFGQTLLAARRLAEAGVPMIAIHFNHMSRCDGWDTHAQNFEALQKELLPMFDQGVSALLEDLHQRGLLEQTLVASWGEFGRTPRINGNAGRDHWGYCSSAFLAGGGIRPGTVVGSSDVLAAHPREHRVDPVDLQATVYYLMGIDPHATIFDPLGRPHAISHGRVIEALL